MALNILPDLETLRDLFDYDPELGLLRYKPRPKSAFKDDACWKRWTTRWAGAVVTSSKKYRYTKTRIDSTVYRVHRIIYKMHYGLEPPELLDHINGDGHDNRITNLRPATQSQNHANRTVLPKSRIGLKGVCLPSDKKRYKAAIRINGRQTHIGYFDTPEEAHAAYCAAAKKHYGEFAGF